MPVGGNQQGVPPPVAPNTGGQMVSPNSNFNPRGIGAPRPQTQAMADKANKKPKGKKKGNGKGKLAPGINPREHDRLSALRRKLSHNEKGPQGQLTDQEQKRYRHMKQKLSGDPKGLQEFLAGDLTYKSQVADYNKNWRNYKNNFLGEREDLRETLDDTLGRMGHEKKRALRSIMEDFGSRGLLHSSFMPKARDEYNDAFQDRRNELTENWGEQKEDLIQNKNLFRDQVKTGKKNARLDAVRRRAQRYGLTGG